MTLSPALKSAAYRHARQHQKAASTRRLRYGTLVDEGRTVVIERGWRSIAGYAGLIGRHDMQTGSSYFEGLCCGKAVIVLDVHADARTEASTLAPYGSTALVNRPLMEQERVAAVLFVSATDVRNWSAEEISFVRNALERPPCGRPVARLKAASAPVMTGVASVLPEHRLGQRPVAIPSGPQP